MRNKSILFVIMLIVFALYILSVVLMKREYIPISFIILALAFIGGFLIIRLITAPVEEDEIEFD